MNELVGFKFIGNSSFWHNLLILTHGRPSSLQSMSNIASQAYKHSYSQCLGMIDVFTSESDYNCFTAIGQVHDV